MRTVLVTGVKGQLGSRLMENVSQDNLRIVGLDKDELDITSPQSISDAMKTCEPDVVINAAAYTAVDRAEEESDRAYAINAEGPRLLAESCARHDVDLIHISTDYVFDGEQDRPYLPSDAPNPKGVYADSKRAGELALEATAGLRWWVIRVAWLCDTRGQNFMQTMLRLGQSGKALRVVHDQHGVPTFARPFAEALLKLAAQPERVPAGIWHYGHEGPTTWFGFAQAIFELNGIDVELSQCTTAEYPTPAKRPAYSYLEGKTFSDLLQLSHVNWKEVLKRELELG
ncbi:MAG: dTDP-4-dehydrorhamnose reductase [Flavobacteriales bacterium]|nr:dTDP-4-dehydrorhamnose reductase [Flavobacteriales bacterium]